MQLVLDYEKEHGRSLELRRHYNGWLKHTLRGGDDDVSAEHVNANPVIRRLVNKTLGHAENEIVTQEALESLQQDPTIRAAIRAMHELLDNGQPGWSQCRFMSMSEQWCNAAPQCQYIKRWWPRKNTCDERKISDKTVIPTLQAPDAVAPRSSLAEKVVSAGTSLGVAALNPVLGALTAVGAAAFFGNRNRKRLQRWQHRIEQHPYKSVMDMWNLSLMGKPGFIGPDGKTWNWPRDPSMPVALAGMASAGTDGTFSRPGLWIQNQEKRQQLQDLLRKVHEAVEGADFKALSQHVRYVQPGEPVYAVE